MTRVVGTELLELAVRVAREAGELVQTMRAVGVDVAGTKSSDIDIVTKADKACEDLIRTRLLDARPGDGFVGEEGSNLVGTSGVSWVVDPIDGTVNYLFGIPQYAVSIGVAVDEEMVAGVVLNPASGEEYSASLGGGATLAGKPIRVRADVPLSQSLVGTGFNYVTEVRVRQGESVARMLPHVRDIRRMGSCALDLCAVASGRLDAYVEEGVNPWDHAAGGLIAQESGARIEVTDGASGQSLMICATDAGFGRFRTLVAASGFLAAGA
ncbi:MAG: suhB 2 [Marmoricola sp.]|nr:suhB 2 [Marmoricola sp.]